MSYKTNPIANRIKFNKGWKTSYLPTKTLNYSRDISLWFKIYLLLKIFLNLKKIQLVFCEIRLDTQNKKIIYILINRKGKQNKKKRKKNTVLKNLLNKFQTPLLKINNESAKFIFYKNLIATQQLSFWQQNPVLKKTLSSSWLTKPKTTSWLNTLQKITFVRRNLLKRKTFWKKKNFVFVQQLKTKFSTNKQKQILTALAKTKTKNHILYGKLIHIAPRSQSLLLKKLVWNLKNEILNNKKKIQKLKKFYTFLLLATPRSPVKKNSKKNLKTLTLARVNHQKFRFLWKILKKKINLFQRARFLKKELPFLLLNFDTKLSPLKEKYNWSFLKKASLLKKFLYLNFLIALFLNKNFLLKNYFLDKQFQLKIQLKKNTNRKEITFPSTRSFQIQTFLKANFLNTKKNKTWKKSPYINVYYQNYIWLLLRKKKLKKQKKLQNNVKFQSKKKSFKKYKKFLNTNKFLRVQLKKNKIHQLKAINQYLKSQKIAKYYKYRLPYRKTHFHFLKLNANFRLKYLIQDWIQKYFNVQMEAKIAHALDFYKNKNYFRLAFPIRKKKKNELLKKHRSSHWNQKKIFLASRLEVGTTLKQITQNDFKKTILAKKNTTVLMKEKLFALSEKKRLKRRLSNDFKRINRSSDFRSKFKYILPTLMDFSKSFEPQLLATVLAKLIQKAKKQTWMLNSIKLLLGLIKLPRTIGYKIVLTGRINSKNKTRSIYITKKQITLQIFSTKMNFAYAQAKARIGTFGLKIWIYSREKLKNEKNYNAAAKYQI